MSMWEVDELLKDSISLVQESNLSVMEKRNLIWSLEHLSEKYEMDAGGFLKTEHDDNALYDEMPPFKMGEIIAKIAMKENQTDFIYDWSAFLLNFSSEYFEDNLKEGRLDEIKEIYHQNNYNNYKPKHATLTIYQAGNDYFSDEQNQLIKWFLDH